MESDFSVDDNAEDEASDRLEKAHAAEGERDSLDRKLAAMKEENDVLKAVLDECVKDRQDYEGEFKRADMKVAEQLQDVAAARSEAHQAREATATVETFLAEAWTEIDLLKRTLAAMDEQRVKIRAGHSRDRGGVRCGSCSSCSHAGCSPRCPWRFLSAEFCRINSRGTGAEQ